jgi:hypothetical protein
MISDEQNDPFTSSPRLVDQGSSKVSGRQHCPHTRTTPPRKIGNHGQACRPVVASRGERTTLGSHHQQLDPHIAVTRNRLRQHACDEGMVRWKFLIQEAN